MHWFMWTKTSRQTLKLKIFISLNIQFVIRVQRDKVRWPGKRNPTQFKYKPMINGAYSSRGNCFQTSQMRRGQGVRASLLFISVSCLIVAPTPICRQPLFSSSALQEWAAKERGTYQTQVTENRNLLLLEIFHQSRRLCVISYKNPIQTELME